MRYLIEIWHPAWNQDSNVGFNNKAKTIAKAKLLRDRFGDDFEITVTDTYNLLEIWSSK